MTEMNNIGENVRLQDMYLEISTDYHRTPKLNGEDHTSAFPELNSKHSVKHKSSKKSRSNSTGKRKKGVTQKSTMIQALKNFADTTSFHGFRHVVNSESFLGRRLLWLLLLCFCSGVMIYQVVDRVFHYYTWPVTVNVRINYNKTLRFPSVTICNQNAFKATSSARLGRYRLLEDIYSGTETFTADDLYKYGAENITLEDLFLNSSHEKADFIRKCYWKGDTCSHEDFKLSLTDHGVCYTFNKGTLDEYISSPGVENGLRLTLNVEQYEYMPGPHDAAGIKMLLHEHNEIPKVHALGQAVSPGSHVFVGVKVFHVTNLPKPHGSCYEKQLDFTETFTISSCQMDCLTILAKQKCDCRHNFMLHENGEPSVCTLRKYFTCLRKIIDMFPLYVESMCECPVPCSFILYEPDISYASTSKFAVQSFLNANDSEKLLNDLLQAKEVTSRMEEFVFRKTQELANDFEYTLKDISDCLTGNLTNVVLKLANESKDYANSLTDLYAYKEFLYRYQIYIVKKNFVRPRDAMEERVIHIVPLAYAEFILTVDNRIRRLADKEFTDSSARMVLHENTIDMLRNRKIIVSLAYDNYTTLIEAYNKGEPIFNYKFEHLTRDYNVPSTPKYLIMQATTHNGYAVKYGQRYGEYLNRTMDILDMLTDLTDFAYTNFSVNESAIFFGREEFRFLMRNFVFARSVFYYETIEWPIGILENRLETFNEYWSKCLTMIENIEQSLISLEKDIIKLRKNLLTPLDRLYVDVMAYFKYENQSKIAISDVLISQEIQKGITDFKTFFNQLRVREANLKDWIGRLEKYALNIWKDILDDVDSKGYYNYTNRFDLMRNFTDVKTELQAFFTKYETLCDFSSVVGNKDSLFIDALERFVDDARDYNSSIKIDSDFVGKNFLQLDIFYRQMSYEEIHQQIAYDIFSLFCDIGGSMGLFLGASALSLFEIIDLILHQSFAKTKKVMTAKTIHVKAQESIGY